MNLSLGSTRVENRNEGNHEMTLVENERVGKCPVLGKKLSFLLEEKSLKTFICAND